MRDNGLDSTTNEPKDTPEQWPELTTAIDNLRDLAFTRGLEAFTYPSAAMIDIRPQEETLQLAADMLEAISPVVVENARSDHHETLSSKLCELAIKLSQEVRGVENGKPEYGTATEICFDKSADSE